MPSRRPIDPVPQSRSLEVFRRSDIAAWGIDPTTARTYIKQGLWVRLHHGVYTDATVYSRALEDPADLHRLLTRASIAALPVPAHAFSTTAAVAHNLPRPGDPPAIGWCRPNCVS